MGKPGHISSVDKKQKVEYAENMYLSTSTGNPTHHMERFLNPTYLSGNEQIGKGEVC